MEAKLEYDHSMSIIHEAIALSLGPALADKLVRKIEKRLPGRHAETH